MNQRTISSSLEDYLEAIAELVELNGHAHTKDIAEKLHFSMASVTNAMQNLAAKNLIVYKPNTPVTLTSEGAEKAAVIRNRHAAMNIFFEKVLKLSYEEADDAACKIEHIIGEKVLSRFVFLADAIINRDDCEQLRRYLNQMLPQLCPDEEETLIPLSELPDGQQAIVVQVGDNLRGKRKIADLGLVRGTLLKMEGRAPTGNLLRIKVMFSSLSLRVQDAAQILVKIATTA